jgi:hypothetical protein
MPTTGELVQWALDHANELERDMSWHPEAPGSLGYWDSTPEAEPKIRARAIAALDFLERFNGHDSQWAIRGHDVFDKSSNSMQSGARALGRSATSCVHGPRL